MSKCFYNSRAWLNGPGSPSTGNVVCFDGETAYDNGPFRNLFISISDCHNSARLHKTFDESVENFINKLKILRSEIDNFITHLEEENETGHIPE